MLEIPLIPLGGRSCTYASSCFYHRKGFTPLFGRRIYTLMRRKSKDKTQRCTQEASREMWAIKSPEKQYVKLDVQFQMPYRECLMNTTLLFVQAEPVAIKVAEDEAINEAFPKAVEDLMAPDGWVHHEFELNTLGRCVTYIAIMLYALRCVVRLPHSALQIAAFYRTDICVHSTSTPSSDSRKALLYRSLLRVVDVGQSSLLSVAQRT